jgi:hypothetical protein
MNASSTETEYFVLATERHKDPGKARVFVLTPKGELVPDAVPGEGFATHALATSARDYYAGPEGQSWPYQHLCLTVWPPDQGSG